jgi:hypothetical protein
MFKGFCSCVPWQCGRREKHPPKLLCGGICPLPPIEWERGKVRRFGMHSYCNNSRGPATAAAAAAAAAASASAEDQSRAGSRQRTRGYGSSTCPVRQNQVGVGTSSYADPRHWATSTGSAVLQQGQAAGRSAGGWRSYRREHHCREVSSGGTGGGPDDQSRVGEGTPVAGRCGGGLFKGFCSNAPWQWGRRVIRLPRLCCAEVSAPYSHWGGAGKSPPVPGATFTHERWEACCCSCRLCVLGAGYQRGCVAAQRAACSDLERWERIAVCPSVPTVRGHGIKAWSLQERGVDSECSKVSARAFHGVWAQRKASPEA